MFLASRVVQRKHRRTALSGTRAIKLILMIVTLIGLGAPARGHAVQTGEATYQPKERLLQLFPQGPQCVAENP
ncbi:hypothetical protein CCUG62472_03905 [Mycobacteroides salmoniphilum]|nr:hypothetical protein CCUG62472_03905 [Mycobacteroides salmoniphilum]